MKITSITLAISFLSVAFAAAGESSGKNIVQEMAPIQGSVVPCLSYDYIDLDYGISDFDNSFLANNGDRYGISFSKSLGELFFLTGGYTNTQADYLLGNQSFGYTGHTYQFGLGARYSLSNCVDLTFEGGGDHHDSRFSANNVANYDSWGYYVGPGLRARAGRFETYAKVFYIGREGVFGQTGNDIDGWVFRPGVLFHMTDFLALKVGGDLGENITGVTFGARLNF